MSNLKSLVINENGFSFDPGTGETYTLNPTAIEILQKLREGKDAFGAGIP